LFSKVYKHRRVISVTLRCQHVVKDLFNLYSETIELLPPDWISMILINDEKSKMSIIADYIAGMTDRFALKQHQLLNNSNFTNTDL